MLPEIQSEERKIINSNEQKNIDTKICDKKLIF
jgi:hypothetical protein